VRVLITAGPTHEHWDDVRFLGNRATGRLGIELAQACADAGHDAVLVLGPSHLAPPDSPRVDTLRVVSARDMLAACESRWPDCDALVATAAVADYRPAERHTGKRPKAGGGDEISLRLVRNPDIVATLARSKAGRPVVGFALQVEQGEERARAKLVGKDLDAIVLDSPAEIGAARGSFLLIPRAGAATPFDDVSKAELARALVSFLSD
jgi:phosphopantothenoylcysteine decarboxylase/phosphopantothenate--cysteine ligase